MGLGPPVCLDCNLVLNCLEEPTARGNYWVCDQCGKECDHERTGHLWGVSKELADKIEQNTKARRAMQKLRESHQ